MKVRNSFSVLHHALFYSVVIHHVQWKRLSHKEVLLKPNYSICAFFSNSKCLFSVWNLCIQELTSLYAVMQLFLSLCNQNYFSNVFLFGLMSHWWLGLGLYFKRLFFSSQLLVDNMRKIKCRSFTFFILTSYYLPAWL